MEKITSYSPATGKEIGNIKLTSFEKIEEIVKDSKKGQIFWNNLEISKKINFFQKLKEKLVESKKELIKLINEEQGKPMIEAEIEIGDCIELIDYYSKNVKEFLQDKEIDSNNKIVYQPIGVVAVISPWNYPFSTPFWAIIPALIAGNSVIFKPSEETPLIGFKIKELFEKANFPKGVFEIIFGRGKEGEKLVRSDVDFISFTGSVEVGKEIMKNSSEKLHRLTLELGGKDPAIVCKDADIDLATQGIVWGTFSNAGQVCTSVERVFVHSSIANKLIKSLVKETEKLQLGKDFGPIINKKLMAKIENQVKDAKIKNGKILIGGKNKVIFIYLQ